MDLEALILSRDPQVVERFQRAFADFSVRVAVESTAERALQSLKSHKYDALVVDCKPDCENDCDHAAEEDTAGVLTAMRTMSSNRRIVGFAVVGGETSARRAYDMGANFVLQKPLLQKEVASSVRAAHGLIVRERRRYHRHILESPPRLHLLIEGQDELFAAVEDVSEGGFSAFIAFLPNQAFAMKGKAKLHFLLPQSKIAIQGQCEIMWWHEDGRFGVRFLQLRITAERELKLWLEQQSEAPAKVQSAS